MIEVMKTYKFKLYSAKRNKKLHRQINVAALAWNHCVALTRRYYKKVWEVAAEVQTSKTSNQTEDSHAVCVPHRNRLAGVAGSHRPALQELRAIF